MSNQRVRVHYRKSDTTAPMIDGGPGQGKIYPTINVYYEGTLQGYGSMYEELRDGVGQYPVAIILDSETMRLTWAELHNVEFI